MHHRMIAEVHHIRLQIVFLVQVNIIIYSVSNFEQKNLKLFETNAIIFRNSMTEPVDNSSNVRVSGVKNNNSSRRDSWDVINKTKGILSHNSLESLANMTESQLSTDLSYNRPRGLDSETEYNTRYNKFELVEKRSAERRGSDDNSDRCRIYS